MASRNGQTSTPVWNAEAEKESWGMGVPGLRTVRTCGDRGRGTRRTDRNPSVGNRLRSTEKMGWRGGRFDGVNDNVNVDNRAGACDGGAGNAAANAAVRARRFTPLGGAGFPARRAEP